MKDAKYAEFMRFIRKARPFFAMMLAIIAVVLLYSGIINKQLSSNDAFDNHILIDSCEAAFSDVMTSVRKSSYLLGFDSKIARLANYDEQTLRSVKGIEEIYDCVDSVQKAVDGNSYIEEIAVYYPKTDFIISSERTYSSYEEYLSNSRRAQQCVNGQAYFSGLMTDYKGPEAVFITDNTEDGTSADYYVSFGQRSGEASCPSRVIITSINMSYLSKELLRIAQAYSYENLIYAGSDGSYIASDSGMVPDYFTGGVFDQSRVSEKYLFEKSEPDVCGNSLIAVWSRGTAQQTVSFISKTFAIALILILVVGILCILIISRRQMAHENEVMARLTDFDDEHLNNMTFEKVIDKLIERNKTAIDEIKQQKSLVESSFLRELLFRNLSAEKDIDILMASYGISLEGNIYRLAAIRKGKNRSSAMWNRVIDSILDVSDEKADILWTKVDRLDILLLNYDSAQVGENLENIIVNKLLDAGISREMITFSSEFAELYKISAAWEEIRESGYTGGLEIISYETAGETDAEKKEKAAVVAHSIIQNEYDNSQLGLYMIAERLGISQSQLSHLFKDTYGISVTQYISQVRIEEAKKLMLSGTDNLKIIALNTGFSSDISLIRVFKKYMNMTPGQFRSNTGNNSDNTENEIENNTGE